MQKLFVGTVLVCWSVVILLTTFQSELQAVLEVSRSEVSVRWILKLILELSLILGIGIPFVALVVRLSGWYENMIKKSSIYGKNSD